MWFGTKKDQIIEWTWIWVRTSDVEIIVRDDVSSDKLELALRLTHFIAGSEQSPGREHMDTENHSEERWKDILS